MDETGLLAQFGPPGKTRFSILADDYIQAGDALTGRPLWKTVFAARSSGRIYCVNAKTGSPLWESALENHEEIELRAKATLAQRVITNHGHILCNAHPFRLVRGRVFLMREPLIEEIRGGKPPDPPHRVCSLASKLGPWVALPPVVRPLGKNQGLGAGHRAEKAGGQAGRPE